MNLQHMAMREARKAAIIHDCPAAKLMGEHNYVDVGDSGFELGHGPQGRRLKCSRCPAIAIVPVMCDDCRVATAITPHRCHGLHAQIFGEQTDQRCNCPNPICREYQESQLAARKK